MAKTQRRDGAPVTGQIILLDVNRDNGVIAEVPANEQWASVTVDGRPFYCVGFDAQGRRQYVPA